MYYINNCTYLARIYLTPLSNTCNYVHHFPCTRSRYFQHCFQEALDGIPDLMYNEVNVHKQEDSITVPVPEQVDWYTITRKFPKTLMKMPNNNVLHEYIMNSLSSVLLGCIQEISFEQKLIVVRNKTHWAQQIGPVLDIYILNIHHQR